MIVARRRKTSTPATSRRTAKRAHAPQQPVLPRGYKSVLADVQRLIADSRHRALSTVNRELVLLYWQIGAVIVRQQETAQWGDAVVEQFAADLRAAFPDMKGLSRDNVFRMRQFCLSCRAVELWAQAHLDGGVEKVGAAPRQSLESLIVGSASPQADSSATRKKVGAARRQFSTRGSRGASPFSPGAECPAIADLLQTLSWTHHHIIMGAVDEPAERYFYMTMAVRERWSVRELRRQIDSDLFTRYVSVREHPEKCLPAEMDQGDLLPFKDHYVLERPGSVQIGRPRPSPPGPDRRGRQNRRGHLPNGSARHETDSAEAEEPARAEGGAK